MLKASETAAVLDSCLKCILFQKLYVDEFDPGKGMCLCYSVWTTLVRFIRLVTC